MSLPEQQAHPWIISSLPIYPVIGRASLIELRFVLRFLSGTVGLLLYRIDDLGALFFQDNLTAFLQIIHIHPGLLHDLIRANARFGSNRFGTRASIRQDSIRPNPTFFNAFINLPA